MGIERNEVLIHASTWINLENVPSEEATCEGPHVVDSVYTEYPKRANLKGQDIDPVAQRLVWGREGRIL